MVGWIKEDNMWQLVTDYGYGEEIEEQSDDYNSLKNDYDHYVREKEQGFLPGLKSIRIKRKDEA